MKIYLVQHGEALAKEVDPERPLSEQGKLDVRGIGRALKGAGVEVQRMIHSGKLRARQTAEILAAEIAPALPLATSERINPNDDPGAFELASEFDGVDTMVVGHLPFMARLASYLLAGREEPPVVAFKPGSVLCLERDDAGAWAVVWMIRPEVVRPLSA